MMKEGAEGEGKVSEMLTLGLEDRGVNKQADQLLSKKKEILYLLPVSGKLEHLKFDNRALKTHVYQIWESGSGEIF